MTQSLWQCARRQVFAARRSWQTQEAYWFWKWGRWEFQLGLFHGVGLGFLVFADEVAITVACLGLTATKESDDC